jgi:hypothetical protein
MCTNLNSNEKEQDTTPSHILSPIINFEWQKLYNNIGKHIGGRNYAVVKITIVGQNATSSYCIH